jgi:hypothetical protein
MTAVEIVEQDLPHQQPRPGWEPPIWLIAVGLCVALVFGFIRAADVYDPRLEGRPTPSPCIEKSAPTTESSYAWNWCR